MLGCHTPLVRRVVLIAVLAVVALFVTATTAPAQSCGRETLSDSYDNGRIDLSWGCECLLDGLTLLAEDSRPEYFSMTREIERHVRAECTGWLVPVDESELMLQATVTEFHRADSGAGHGIYSVPWEIVIAGIVAGGLVVLIGAAAVRQWRLRL